LERGVADLLVGHGRIEVEEVFDVSAHEGIIGKVGRVKKQKQVLRLRQRMTTKKIDGLH
jgi:hypothetical protein